MSLADELMADLEGSDEEEEAEVKEEDEEMDSEDIKPSKLELEQVFFLSSIRVLIILILITTLIFLYNCNPIDTLNIISEILNFRFSPRSRLCRRLRCCTTPTGCSRS